MALNISVIAPDKIVYQNVVDEVIIPSKTGLLGILESHAPLLTALDTAGILRIRNGNDWVPIVVLGGFAEVEEDKVTVLATAAELGDKIDISEAKLEMEEALKKFNKAENVKEKNEAAQVLKRTKVRLEAALNQENK
uniref:ATP synthase CF1 epsilon subunit n=1 Tax=Glaucocystis sp. BBH TaxID=2023628 RepID=A0A3G1IV17_9EUKA|nr:ATP synthase CF1 epsilon subunit [Glaucocystis sp. BBH]